MKQEHDILTGVGDLIERLYKRAEIREQITSRKSVQEGKPDRINDLLREAAKTITLLATENRTAKPYGDLVQSLVAKLKQQQADFEAKHGKLVKTYDEFCEDQILNCYKDVVSHPDSELIHETDGQFTGGCYDEYWVLYNRTYFFTMCWNKEKPEYLELKIYEKSN